jgi:hypothetical protein
MIRPIGLGPNMSFGSPSPDDLELKRNQTPRPEKSRAHVFLGQRGRAKKIAKSATMQRMQPSRGGRS